jgi:hypothetical protein
MSKLLATTLTVLAAAGCAAPVATDPIDDEPPPSSRPIKHVGDAMKSPSEKDAKPGDPRPATGECPDGDLKSDADFAPYFPGGPGNDFVVGGWTPTGFVDPKAN